jgi:hypothetical protein
MGLDASWIAGVGRGWKAWADRASHLRAIDSSATATANVCLAYLREGHDFLQRLTDDLMLNKGLWNRMEQEGPKARVPWLLRVASGVLFQAQGDLQGQHEFRLYRQEHEVVRSMLAAVSKAAREADDSVRKLLHELETYVEAGGKAGAALPPDVVNLGKVKVIFYDSLSNPADDLDYIGDRDAVRDPASRKEYIKRFLQAKAFLDRRGLGFLWYGDIEVHPLANSKPLPVGEGGEVAGAMYVRQGDRIDIYDHPNNYIPRLLVHEIGHRFWFKFLTDENRHNFDKYFGKVPAVTEYGATLSQEDFAEVFTAYVWGKDMSRDQLERFKVVLGQKKRTEGLRELTGVLRKLYS